MQQNSTGEYDDNEGLLEEYLEESTDTIIKLMRYNMEQYSREQRKDLTKLLKEYRNNIKAVLATQNKLNALLLGRKI